MSISWLACLRKSNTKVWSAYLPGSVGLVRGPCSSPKPELPFTVPSTKPLTPSSLEDLHLSSHLRLSCASVFASLGLYLSRFPPTLYSRNAKEQKKAEAPLQDVLFSQFHQSPATAGGPRWLGEGGWVEAKHLLSSLVSANNLKTLADLLAWS